MNVICNLSHGLLYVLCKLLTALFMMIQNKDVYRQLEQAENALERLENIRRSVSNYQNNTKEKLKKEDVEEIETALHKWEQSIMLMNLEKGEEKKKEIDNDLER